MHRTSYIVGMCAAVISTKKLRKVYALEESETGSLQAISYIIINVRFTVIGEYKYGGIKNRPVITESKLANKTTIVKTKAIMTFRSRIKKFISTLVPFN